LIIGIVHVILIFQLPRTGLFCSWKQLFAAGSTINVKQKLFDQSQHAEPYTNKVEWSTQYAYCNRMGGTKIFQGSITTIVMWWCFEFHWSCQHSGSGSNCL